MLATTVINLDSRPDRWQQIAASLGAAGITNYTRFTATPMQSPLFANPSWVAPEALAASQERILDHRVAPWAAIACALSHLRAWEQALSQPSVSRLLVMEDDALPTAALRVRTLASMPADADVLFLGCKPMLVGRRRWWPVRSRRLFYFNGTWGYVITRAGMQKLLPQLRPVRMHIDHQISQLLTVEPYALVAYCREPEWLEHDDVSPADITYEDIDLAAADAAEKALLLQARERLLDRGLHCNIVLR